MRRTAISIIQLAKATLYKSLMVGTYDCDVNEWTQMSQGPPILMFIPLYDD